MNSSPDREALIDRLMLEFSLPDREDLAHAIGLAEQECVVERIQNVWHRHAMPSELDALDEPLRATVTLLTGGMANSIALELRAGGFGWGSVDEINDVCRRLADIGKAAKRAPRDRPLSHRPPNNALRALVAPLADYWRVTLGRKFTQDQVWAPGPAGEKMPPTEATRFVYAVVEHLAPGAAGPGLRTIAREFTGKGG